MLLLNQRFENFIRWTRPEPETMADISRQRDDVRSRVRGQAEEDGLTVRSTPNSGSFATATGLRRHMRGLSEVEGQDVDVPFVVAPKTEDDERLEVLLPRFEKYARISYPDTERETSKSSVKLKFTSNLSYDLVPLLATRDRDRQILIRADGERRETSVQKHVEFITSRTKKGLTTGVAVEFNELIRLGKWWRCVRQAEDGSSLTDVPSFLINLLFAHAFDVRGLRETYAATTADWFGHLARVVRKRIPISFSDYGTGPAASTAPSTVWAVHDPVNPDNNIVSKWTGIMCDGLAEWLEEGRDAMYDAMAAFDDDRETDGIDHLVKVLGTAFIPHSEAAT
ncbi:MAG TPA: CBASS oligonucleotide cyclase [Polyangia bacterium]|nr:CBASS oligonucleotide cyclase [Polyangia bacterium]